MVPKAGSWSSAVCKIPSLEKYKVKKGSTPSFSAISHTFKSYRDEQLSWALHASLPSRQDISRICAARKRSLVLAHETLTTPLSVLEQRGLATAKTVLDLPEATAHPVRSLTARFMLLLATLLQYQGINDLSGSEQAVMERLVGLATSMVTKNDRFLGSIEGLKCLIIESA